MTQLLKTPFLMAKAKKHNKQSVRVESAADMQKLAASIATKIVAAPPDKEAKVIALTGDLGAGKTTFSQGFLKALGVRRRIISPTFLIVRPYSLSVARTNFTRAFHIDCYRLKHADELQALGLSEMLSNPKHIVLIEWPELVASLLPRGVMTIDLEHSRSGEGRTVYVSKELL